MSKGAKSAYRAAKHKLNSRGHAFKPKVKSSRKQLRGRTRQSLNAAMNDNDTAPIVDLTSSQGHTPAPAPPPPLASPQHALSAWNLPPSLVRTYRHLGVPSLFDWQVQCLQLPGVLSGHSNLLYSASTAAGKTLVSEIILMNRLRQADKEADASSTASAAVATASKKVMIVLPFVSIVDEKCRDLTAKLSPLGFCVKSYHGQQSASSREEALESQSAPSSQTPVLPAFSFNHHTTLCASGHPRHGHWYAIRHLVEPLPACTICCWP